MVRRKAAAPVEEIEEADDVFEDVDDLEEPEEDDLEELEEVEEEDEEEVPAPKRGRPAKSAAAPAKKTAPKTASSEFDSNWLASYVSEETGVAYDSRAIRMLLRKLAKDGSLDREIGSDRTRYNFPKGPNDITVKQVVKLVKSGEAAAVKKAGLETAQATRAAKKAAPPVKAAAPAKAAPVKRAAKAAPAKAATATRRRRAAE